MDALQLIREMFRADRLWATPGVAAVVNPFNNSDYVHFSSFEHIEGQDDYKAWSGRGDAYKLHFYDEDGGSFSLCFGFHKGNMSAWVEKGDPANHPYALDDGTDDSNFGPIRDLDSDDETPEIPF